MFIVFEVDENIGVEVFILLSLDMLLGIKRKESLDRTSYDSLLRLATILCSVKTVTITQIRSKNDTNLIIFRGLFNSNTSFFD